MMQARSYVKYVDTLQLTLLNHSSIVNHDLVIFFIQPFRKARLTQACKSVLNFQNWTNFKLHYSVALKL